MWSVANIADWMGQPVIKYGRNLITSWLGKWVKQKGRAGREKKYSKPNLGASIALAYRRN